MAGEKFFPGDAQAAIRAVTGKTYDYNGDWHALFDLAGIATGDWNGRFIQWCNGQFGTSFTNFPEALQYTLDYAHTNGWAATVSSGSSYLDSISGLNAAHEYDATIADSYTSGQTWNSLISAVDITLGVNAGDATNDPDFTGSVGDAGAYWASGDGDEHFTDLNGSQIWDYAHLSGGNAVGPVWFAIYGSFVWPSAGQIHLMGNRQGGTETGWNLSLRLDGELRFIMRGDTAQITTSMTAASAVPNGTDALIIFSLDSTSAGSEKVGVNTGTLSAWSSSYSPDSSSTDSTNNFCVGTAENATGPALEAGSKVYAFACGTGHPSDADAASLKSLWEARRA